MGLFDELDIAGASDNPFAIPDDTYEAVVSDLVVKTNEEKGTTGMTVKYKITAGEETGREITEYRRMPKATDKTPLSDAEAAKARSYIKRTLARLGIPEDRMNSATRDDLVGIQCYVSTTMNGDFINVRDVTLSRPADLGSSTSADANPFAAQAAE
jgi:hypothetical protein